MDDAQAERARTDGYGLSVRGNDTARRSSISEPILKEAEQRFQEHADPRFGTLLVQRLRVAGQPEPWGWRVGGHHIGISFTDVDRDYVAATPPFSAQIRPRCATDRTRALTLADEDLARRLLGSLDGGQKSVAIVRAVAPDDILTENFGG
ncbi:MAG: DUF3500 domain-containing protein [Thermomicrobiales bacterium]